MRKPLVVGVLVGIATVTLLASTALAQNATGSGIELATEVRQLQAAAQSTLALVGGGLLLGAGIGTLVGATGTYAYWRSKL